MSGKSKAWYAKFPLDAYALGPFRYDDEITEEEFRGRLRKWEGVKRLPMGTQVWPTK
jgi:hypothetical protein